MRLKYILPLLLVIDIFVLLYESTTLSISYNEAHLYFGYYEIISYCTHFFTALFGQNDISLRFCMILLHLGSVILFYKLSFFYLKEEKERLIVVVLFLLLPGVISAALILNSAGLVIFLTLLFVYLYKKRVSLYLLYFLLFIYSFLDNSFLYLYFSLILYGIYQKNWEFSGFNFIFLVINLYLYGIDIGGYPSGHFLDTLGIYAAVFSPIVFIYIVYALYRTFLIKDLDILWFIATVPLIFSLLVSLRQFVHVEYYAPYVIIALIIAAKTFLNSYKVRLPLFRRKYRFLFYIILFFLLLNFIVVLTNKHLYAFFPTPKKHFAYKHHIVKELAQKLKNDAIECVHTDYKMQLRLRFYGINECQSVTLSSFAKPNSKKVTIRYNSKDIYQTYVTKLNNH